MLGELLESDVHVLIACICESCLRYCTVTDEVVLVAWVSVVSAVGAAIVSFMVVGRAVTVQVRRT